jgi:hypothetical protein
LNDILSVKFKQLEDTKQAMRSMITYQKYYHLVQTQQLITDNLMQLKATKNDMGFIQWQQKMYGEIIDKTRNTIASSTWKKDLDLEEHQH